MDQVERKRRARQLSVGRSVRTRSESLATGILGMAEEGTIERDSHWVRAALEKVRKSEEVSRPFGKGGYLTSLEKEIAGIDRAALPAHMRGRLAAVRKQVANMRSSSKSGKLNATDEMSGVALASEAAFDILGGSGKEKDAKGLFTLAAQSNDELTRQGLAGAFKRGLVSDVASEKGMPWEKAAKGLSSLGLISKNDPRLSVDGAAINGAMKAAGLGIDRDEVNSGTAKTSVKQMSRSLDDATATIGNRMNGRGEEGGRGKDFEMGTASGRRNKATELEARGLTSANSSNGRALAVGYFTAAGAEVAHGQLLEAELRKKKKKIFSR